MNNVNAIYSLRNSFSIIGLTGRMACGCSEVGEILSKDLTKFKTDNSKSYRDCTTLTIDKDVLGENLFERKYKIANNFVLKHWKSYKTIEYKKVLFLFLLNLIKNEVEANKSLRIAIQELFVGAEDGSDSRCV